MDLSLAHLLHCTLMIPLNFLFILASMRFEDFPLYVLLVILSQDYEVKVSTQQPSVQGWPDSAGSEKCGEPGKLVFCPEVEKYRVHDLYLLVSSMRGSSSLLSSRLAVISTLSSLYRQC